MTKQHASETSHGARLEATAKQIGDRSASFFERFGLGRLAAGIVLVVLGFLVLVFPALIAWFVGIGAIILGILVLAGASPKTM